MLRPGEWVERMEHAVHETERQGRMPKAEQLYRSAVADLKSQPSHPERDGALALAYSRLANARYAADDHAGARVLAPIAVDLARASGSDLRLIEALVLLANVLGNDRQSEARDAVAEACLVAATGSTPEHRKLHGWAVLIGANLARRAGDLVQAEEQIAQAVALLEAVDNWAGLAAAHQVLSMIRRAEGREPEAAALMAVAGTYSQKADAL